MKSKFLLITFILSGIFGCSNFKSAEKDEKNGTPITDTSIHGPAKGIFWMVTLPRDFKMSERTSSTLAQNDCLDGIFIRTHWNNIEKSNGDYDWSRLEWIIDLARKNDLQYKVMLLPGENTPEWVYQEGAEAFRTTFPWPLRSEYGQVTKIPLPWDPVYQHFFRRMLKKFEDRYGDDEHFVALTLTGVNFVYGEMHLPKTPKDIAQWETYGNYQDRIEEVYKKLLDFYAQTFPRQQMVLHITMPIPGMGENVDNIVHYGVDNYPQRITLQNAQLTGHQSNDRMFSYRIIFKYKDQAHVGFQSLHSFVNFPERVGSPEVATYNFVNAGGEFWELLKDDGLDDTFACRLAEMITKARSMGAEAYLEELKKTGEFDYVNDFAQQRELMDKLQKEGSYEEALAILNETFRFTYRDITKKVELLQLAGRTKDAISFLISIIEKRNTTAFHEMLAAVYADANDFGAAIENLEEAYLWSERGLYLFEQGRLYAERGMETKARATLMRFIEDKSRTQRVYKRVADLYQKYGFEHSLELLQIEAARDGYTNIID